MEFVFASYSFDVWESWTLQGPLEECRLINCRNPSVSSHHFCSPHYFVQLATYWVEIMDPRRDQGFISSEDLWRILKVAKHSYTEHIVCDRLNPWDKRVSPLIVPLFFLLLCYLLFNLLSLLQMAGNFGCMHRDSGSCRGGWWGYSLARLGC